MKHSLLLLALCLFFIMGIPRLFSLDAHWSSNETFWLQQSAKFITAVQTGQFDQTSLAYHPGVTTMWVAGLRQIFGKASVRVSVKDLALARWFIGVGVWIGLVGAFFLIYKIFAFWPATTIWAFLALNPFFLAQSRRVHTDALATVFILLTVLLFILYCISPKRRGYLILSGISFGLACLTKSYSLIILLWGPVCLLLFRQREHTWREFFFHTLLSKILFLNCTLITVFAVWPIFWTPLFGLRGICLLGAIYLLTCVKGRYRTIRVITAGGVLAAVGFFALRTMWEVFSGVAWAVTTAHEVEHLFLEKVVYDPGWLFYPFALSIKSTPFTIPFATFGVFWLWKQRKQIHLSGQWLKITLSLVCCILLFTLCLSLTATKFSRYLLPVFPMIDLLAGLGFFYATKGIGSQLKTKLSQQVGQIIFCILIFALTSVPVFVLHPYYGTYYNFCWRIADITKIITVGEASGLDIAAKYINQKPKAEQMLVQVSPLGTEFFQYYFSGTAYRGNKGFVENTSELRPADYEVVYIRDSQTGSVPQIGTRNGQLEYTVILNGIEHVWIYRVQAEAN